MSKEKLYVGNLSYSVTNEQLEKLFSQYGKVKQVNIIEGKGFGFVEMSSRSEAEKAKEALNGFEFEGRTLKVDEARENKGTRTDSTSKSTQEKFDLAQIVKKIEGLDSLEKLSADELVEYAKIIGKHLSPKGVNLSTSQIRKFLDAVNRLDNLRQKKEGFEGMKDQIPLLRPQIAYAVGRDKDKKAEQLMNVLEPCFGRIKGEKCFKNLVKFVEAIVAYHKYYDGD